MLESDFVVDHIIKLSQSAGTSTNSVDATCLNLTLAPLQLRLERFMSEIGYMYKGVVTSLRQKESSKNAPLRDETTCVHEHDQEQLRGRSLDFVSSFLA